MKHILLLSFILFVSSMSLWSQTIDLAKVEKDGKWGYIDNSGEVVIPLQFDDAGDFSANGLAGVKRFGKWGYINTSGEVVIPYQFEWASSFSADGLALVKRFGKWGYINTLGDLNRHYQFDKANAIAVVIGNRDYKNIKNHDHAINDAQAMKNYLITSLGYKEGNIIYLENASNSDLEVVFGNESGHGGQLKDLIKPGVSDVFIYYSGHGAPGFSGTSSAGYFVTSDAELQYN